jgi:hypothetical protein
MQGRAFAPHEIGTERASSKWARTYVAGATPVSASGEARSKALRQSGYVVLRFVEVNPLNAACSCTRDVLKVVVDEGRLRRLGRDECQPQFEPPWRRFGEAHVCGHDHWVERVIEALERTEPPHSI